jgi:hypothetical protein
LQKKEQRLASELQRVRSAIADRHGSSDAIPQHSSSSSSIPAVRIQPAAQSIIHLHGENDRSHQIALAYWEPDGSGRSPASNASSIPIYTCVVDALAIGASLEEFSVNAVNSTYQFILRTHTLRGHPTDMARIALMSPHIRGRGVSTPTVLIANLAEALQATVEHVWQSSDTFDVKSPLQIEFELQMGDARGHGSARFFRLEVLNLSRGGIGLRGPGAGIW